jgi:hypothetical protein
VRTCVPIGLRYAPSVSRDTQAGQLLSLLREVTELLASGQHVELVIIDGKLVGYQLVLPGARYDASKVHAPGAYHASL